MRGGWSETTLIPDDAYYYFTIARHIVLGAGPTFDGLAPTNGFHPLWLGLLLPLYGLAPQSIWAPVRAALAVNALFDSLTGWLLFRLIDARLGRRAAWGSAILWLCAPTSAILAFFGMEGSLVTVLLVALLAVALDRRRRERSAPRHAVLTGLLWGACSLARTDQILLCGAALAVLAVGQPVAWRQRLRWFGLAALVAGGVLAPWFIWNKATFGTFEQVSSRAKRHAKGLWGALPHDWSSPKAAVATATTALCPPVVVVTRYMSVEYLEHLRIRWTPWLVAAWLIPGLALALRGAWRMRARGELELLAFGAAYLIGQIVLYGMVLRFYAAWYASPFMAIAGIFVAAGALLDGDGKRAARFVIPPFVVMAAVQGMLLLLFARDALHGKGGAELRWRTHFDGLRKPTQRDVRIGLYDAGAAGYIATWYPHITVINLDGLVNNAAIDALERGQYPEYVAANVEVLMQSPRRAGMFLGPAEYARLLDLLEKRGMDMKQFR